MAQRIKMHEIAFSRGNFYDTLKAWIHLRFVCLCTFQLSWDWERERDKRKKINNDELKINFFHFFMAFFSHPTLISKTNDVLLMCSNHLINYIILFVLRRLSSGTNKKRMYLRRVKLKCRLKRVNIPADSGFSPSTSLSYVLEQFLFSAAALFRQERQN